MSAVATDSTKRCAATLGFLAEMDANSKHNNWNLICHQMGYESAPLAIETGEHPASKDFLGIGGWKNADFLNVDIEVVCYGDMRFQGSHDPSRITTKV